MINPAQLSLFSLNAQKSLLGKYGILISAKENAGIIIETYQLKRSYFKVYFNLKQNKIINITPSNSML